MITENNTAGKSKAPAQTTKNVTTTPKGKDTAPNYRRKKKKPVNKPTGAVFVSEETKTELPLLEFKPVASPIRTSAMEALDATGSKVKVVEVDSSVLKEVTGGTSSKPVPATDLSLKTGQVGVISTVDSSTVAKTVNTQDSNSLPKPNWKGRMAACVIFGVLAAISTIHPDVLLGLRIASGLVLVCCVGYALNIIKMWRSESRKV